ncbi:MAG TPA: hypothetical protein VGE01_00440 [Fimbriimonas sp.]
MKKLFEFLPKRIRDHEDSLIGVALAWLLVTPLLALTGFYLGTIVGHDWGRGAHDYQPVDMANGGIGALIGLAVGIIAAIVVTATYPKLVEADHAARASHHH